MSATIRPSARGLPAEQAAPLDGWACNHPNFHAVADWIIRRIVTLYDPAVFLVVGPTGVGKSTLIEVLRRELAARMQSEMLKNPAVLPSVLAEAVYIPGRGFDWTTLFEDLLKDGREVLVHRKISRCWDEGTGSLRGLASGVNEMLLRHRPAVAIIDEGGCLVESGASDSLKKNVSYLKSIGNRSRTHIAIFGDYSLARLTEFSGQLDRRCHLVHFAPYQPGQETVYSQIVATFERRLTSQGGHASLSSSSQLLFERTCGCVGLLHRWVVDAQIAAEESGQALNAEILEKTTAPEAAVARWRQEIAAGATEMSRYFGIKET